MKYYLVGDVGMDTLETGKSTIIRKRRTLLGSEWSYLYRVGLEQESWQREQAPDPADAEKRLFWGKWQDWDMVEAGRYPSIQGISESHALELIKLSVACSFCGRSSDTHKSIER